MIRNIVKYQVDRTGDWKKFLKTPSYQINFKSNEEMVALPDLIKDMIDTMYAANGVGLAAVQIGINKAIAVLDLVAIKNASDPDIYVTKFPREELVIINPEIVDKQDTQLSKEGCLSISGLLETVSRANQVHVRYMDQNGDKKDIFGIGYLARALQHEIDHTNGVLFIDHVKQDRSFKRRLAVCCT